MILGFVTHSETDRMNDDLSSKPLSLLDGRLFVRIVLVTRSIVPIGRTQPGLLQKLTWWRRLHHPSAHYLPSTLL
jgi:hypothetical protein